MEEKSISAIGTWVAKPTFLSDPGLGLARGVGQWLISYREDNGLTQTELAKKLHTVQPAVSRIEAMRTNPSWATLGHISRILGVQFVVTVCNNETSVQISELANTLVGGLNGS